MNLFSSSPAKKHLKSAQKAFKSDEFKESMRLLTFGFREDVEYKPLYQLAIRCLEKLGGDHEKHLFEAALKNFKGFEPFYELGRHFLSNGLYDLAFPFAEKANRIDPQHQDAAYTFSLACSGRFQVKKALEVLEKIDTQEDFWLAHRFYYCKLLNGQLDGVKQFLLTARKHLQSMDQGPDEQAALNSLLELEEMMTRLIVIDKPQNHIRDWHFIQYGAAILDYFEDPERYVAGGRYVAVWSTNEAVRNAAEYLKIFLKKTDRLPKSVVALGDRDSQITGRVIAEVLGVDFEPFDLRMVIGPNVLVVAGDSSSFNSEQLSQIAHDQTAFALNHNWLRAAAVTPDVAGFLSQTFAFPWQGGAMKVIDPDAGKVEQSQPDDRGAEEIAAEIAALKPELEPEFETTAKFYESVKEHLKGGTRGGKYRWPFVLDSPVPGSYFH